MSLGKETVRTEACPSRLPVRGDAAAESILGSELGGVMQRSPNVPHLCFPAFEQDKSLLLPLKPLGSA